MRTEAGGQGYCEKRKGTESEKEGNSAAVLAVPSFCCKEGSLQRRSLGCLFAHDAIASGQSSGLSLFQPQVSFPGR